MKTKTPSEIQQKKQLIRTLQDQGKLRVTKDDEPWGLKNNGGLTGQKK